MSEGERRSAASVTDLLVACREGDQAAHERLIGKVYPELRRLAASHLRRERPDHTLDEPAAVVHEVYLRLVDQDRVDWQNRKHFYAVASRMMRRILIDHARARERHKRRGQKVSLHDGDAVSPAVSVDVLALDAALTKLEASGHEFESQVVELRFFGGLTIAEMAEQLACGHATVERAWAFAKGWLFRELGGGRRRR